MFRFNVLLSVVDPRDKSNKSTFGRSILAGTVEEAIAECKLEASRDWKVKKVLKAVLSSVQPKSVR
jgi:hypothetical protein